jgi:hypothetical protein
MMMMMIIIIIIIIMWLGSILTIVPSKSAIFPQNYFRPFSLNLLVKLSVFYDILGVITRVIV